MSRLLSSLLLAALCWVSGNHCLKSKIFNAVWAPSVDCMHDAIVKVKGRLDDGINLTMSGKRGDVRYEIYQTRLIGLKNIAVLSVSSVKEDVNEFPQISALNVWRTDLELRWPSIVFQLDGRFDKCPNGPCNDTSVGSGIYTLRPLNVELSWLMALSSDDDPSVTQHFLSSSGIGLDIKSKTGIEAPGAWSSGFSDEVFDIFEEVVNNNPEKIKQQLQEKVDTWFHTDVLGALVDAAASYSYTNTAGVGQPIAWRSVVPGRLPPV